MDFYRNKHLDPPPPPGKKFDPLENVGPPLDPWKSKVFSVIKPLDPLYPRLMFMLMGQACESFKAVMPGLRSLLLHALIAYCFLMNMLSSQMAIGAINTFT